MNSIFFFFLFFLFFFNGTNTTKYATQLREKRKKERRKKDVLAGGNSFMSLQRFVHSNTCEKREKCAQKMNRFVWLFSAMRALQKDFRCTPMGKFFFFSSRVFFSSSSSSVSVFL